MVSRVLAVIQRSRTEAVTYSFFTVISGAGKGQEIEYDAAVKLNESMPLNIMYSYLYLNMSKVEPLHPFEKTFLDSGAYSKIGDNGEYPFSFEDYIQYTKDYDFNYVSTLDYPCDERLISGLSIKERVEKTADNTAELIDYIPNLVPVLQGKTYDDYVYSLKLYEERDLLKEYIGIGSICIRKKTSEIVRIVKNLYHRLPRNTKIHCFGLEIPSIKKLHPYIESSDSHTWGSEYQIGGRLIFYNNGRLEKFPRNGTHLDICAYINMASYNHYINHITRKNGTLKNYMENV